MSDEGRRQMSEIEIIGSQARVIAEQLERIQQLENSLALALDLMTPEQREQWRNAP